MRIVVLGGTGHIGTWLVPRLVHGGHEVIAITRGIRQPYHDSAGWQSVEQVCVDREEAERDGSFGSTIASLAPDVVVDLICFDLASATHLVEALRDRVGHFLHCGTLWVHGVPEIRPYDEDAPRKPFGEYGIRKSQIERYLLNEAAAGFPASVLHPGHITGPGWLPVNPSGNLDFAVFERLAGGESVVLPDKGLATLQHVHADDVAQAFELAIALPEAAIGEAFHVAATEPVTMRDYAIAAAAWFGREANLEFAPWEQWQATVTPRAAAITRDHIMHSPHASIMKAQRSLGFTPQYTGVEAARDAVNWQLRNAGDNLQSSSAPRP